MDPTPAVPAVRIEHARKVYPGQIGVPAKEAVADVSLNVEPGTIHGLLGPNGAGKTTTLKMLVGLVRPTSGTFSVLGRDPRKPAGRAPLGFLPEQPYFPMQLTAAGVMRLHGRLCGLSAPEIRERTGTLLETVGLEGKGREQLSRFSRGMLQRLGLAQALIGRPRVVLLDEPAGGLDPVGQRDVRNLMLELRSEGVTVLLSSHQLSEVEAVCDRVTVLKAGTVAAEGRLDDLLNFVGRTSIRADGLGEELPPGIRRVVEDVALSSGTWIFSVPDSQVRGVIDAIDDAGGRVVAVAPKRASLEEYFAGLLEQRDRGEGPAEEEAA
ncbi:MAG: ABC transporter ATP-binding protein [Coriobacteriia bacterium]|nr:ABC transporter ATP-binding protein [Coriobacteriia bacterium]